MSQTISHSSNFENCLEVLCQSFLKNRRFINKNNIKNKPFFKSFTGQHIGAFKRTYPTIINSSFSDNANFEIDNKNVGKVLFSLFVKSLPKNFGEFTYTLCDLVNFNPHISESGCFNEDDLNVLIDLKIKAESEFNYDVEDPFVVNDTQQTKVQNQSNSEVQPKLNNTTSLSEDSIHIFKAS
ncbi:unnamed protein product [Brachionus calyciflorus]|uniref:Uncharacterized protein n=1 Tax=Brachionus calyciflorus TaxID=104777 RepID=A0A814NSP5_9BILA|nr:unnamed protein product [Brachionus calyciflorus]